jgi:hypothetical protein
MKKIVEEQKQKDGSDGRGAASAGANRGGETRDLAQRPERRGGDEGESPLYVQQALVRAVRREKRPTAKNPEREVVVVEFVASTEIIDSHDSIVRSNWDLTRYTKNPVLIWMHGRMNDLPAVGNVENLQKVGSTKHEGNAVFDDTTEFDRAVAAKYEKGVLKGFSIGFYPRTVQWERIDGEEVVVLDDIEILEISCVNVPSNPEALAKADRAALAEVEARATTKWERALARLRERLRVRRHVDARDFEDLDVVEHDDFLAVDAFPLHRARVEADREALEDALLELRRDRAIELRRVVEDGIPLVLRGADLLEILDVAHRGEVVHPAVHPDEHGVLRVPREVPVRPDDRVVRVDDLRARYELNDDDFALGVLRSRAFLSAHCAHEGLLHVQRTLALIPATSLRSLSEVSRFSASIRSCRRCASSIAAVLLLLLFHDLLHGRSPPPSR